MLHFKHLPHPTIRKERREQPKVWERCLPCKDWTGLSHDGYQGSPGRAVLGSKPRWGAVRTEEMLEGALAPYPIS